MADPQSAPRSANHRNSRRDVLVKRLASEGLKTLDFFRELHPEDWSRQVYTAGSGWKVNQVLCHILNAEQGFHHLISDILLGGPGAPEDLDIDVYNEERIRAMHCQDREALLKAFSQARITTMEIVRRMQPEDFERVGRHPYLGVTTLDAMLKLIYRHVMLHQRDIRRTIDHDQPVDLAEPAPDGQG
jgi:hypothetical protein